MGGGLIETVTMLKENKPMSDAHNDLPPHTHKIYKPGDHPQSDTKEHWPTVTMMGVETVRPQVKGSIELVEDQLVNQKRTGNVNTENRENFWFNVIVRGASNTPESSSTMIDLSRLQVTSVESDTARSSME